MYQLRIDILGNDYLTRSEYEGAFASMEDARQAAQNKLKVLSRQYLDYKIKNYTITIIPLNS